MSVNDFLWLLKLCLWLTNYAPPNHPIPPLPTPPGVLFAGVPLYVHFTDSSCHHSLLLESSNATPWQVFFVASACIHSSFHTIPSNPSSIFLNEVIFQFKYLNSNCIPNFHFVRLTVFFVTQYPHLNPIVLVANKSSFCPFALRSHNSSDTSTSGARTSWGSRTPTRTRAFLTLG